MIPFSRIGRLDSRLPRRAAEASLLASVFALFTACSEDSGGPGGGETGGASTGGAATGGASTGGAATGGAATGGAATGGAATGGTTGVGGSDATGGGSPAGGSGTGGLQGSGGDDGAGGQGSGGDSSTGGAMGSGGDASGGSDGSGGGSGEAQSAGCGTERTLMNGRKTIQSGGMNREYILRVPDDYDNTKPYRLIFAFHWLGGNANQVAEGGNGGSTEDPYYGLWDLAEGSTIFVAPEGLNGALGSGWENSNGQDVNLTDAILDEVQNDLCIDTSRIFSTGFSYGGGMSYALACARADVFRGVALYAGAQLSGCSGGTTPIAYFHAHGVRDGVLDISQGRGLRDNFVGVNGCTPQSPPEPPRDSGTHICTSYEGCMEGYPVRWCAHGGDHNPTEKDSGQDKSWVPGEAWDFISQF